MIVRHIHSQFTSYFFIVSNSRWIRLKLRLIKIIVGIMLIYSYPAGGLHLFLEKKTKQKIQGCFLSSTSIIAVIARRYSLSRLFGNEAISSYLKDRFTLFAMTKTILQNTVHFQVSGGLLPTFLAEEKSWSQ